MLRLSLQLCCSSAVSNLLMAVQSCPPSTFTCWQPAGPFLSHLITAVCMLAVMQKKDDVGLIDGRPKCLIDGLNGH